MGTNYYKRKSLSKEWKEKMIDAIKHDRVETDDEWGRLVLKDENGDWINPPKRDVHIGKRSAGWKFLFDHNDWRYFKESKQAFVDWVNDPETGIIVDEYDEVLTPEQFWEEVVKPTYEPDENGEYRLDSRTYIVYKEKLKEPVYSYARHDFYVEDLRFANSTNFS